MQTIRQDIVLCGPAWTKKASTSSKQSVPLLYCPIMLKALCVQFKNITVQAIHCPPNPSQLVIQFTNLGGWKVGSTALPLHV